MSETGEGRAGGDFAAVETLFIYVIFQFCVVNDDQRIN
jgi:hypothetical protein